MKKRFKKIFLFAIVILSIVCIYPIGVKAISGEISYTDVSDVKNLDVRDLSFSNIRFEDYSDTSTMAFGLSGVVFNNSDDSITYSANVYFYDEDYNLITEEARSKMALTGSNEFDLMFNLDILGEYSTDDIKYYRLIIDTYNDIVTSNNNAPSENSMYASYDYVIDNYDVNIVVNSNNTFDITETITAYFNVPKQGIFRTIPLSNKIVRFDGSTSINRTQVTNLSVSDEFTISREGDNYKINIGSARRSLSGEKTYTIKYTYNLGKDPLSGYDELYYNIIDTEWDTVINNVTFNITMPKEFDSSKLGFSSGSKGFHDNSKVKYTVNGNTISGSYDGILNAGEALTVRCELPEEYFENEVSVIEYDIYLMFIIPIVSLIISFLLWFIFGRDKKVVETVEFYPPEGFNSLEVGFLYKGKANSTDVTSLLIYLANKGYIKIVENEVESLFVESKDFKIIKIKDYDGDDVNEKKFLNGLFEKTAKPGVATKEDLTANFFLTVHNIITNINNKENKYKLFDKKASIISKFIIVFILVSYFSITIPPIFTYGNLDYLIPALFMPAVGCIITTYFLFNKNALVYEDGKVTKSPIKSKILISIWGLGFGGVPWAIFVLPSLLQRTSYFICYVLGLLCILGMVICFKYFPKRTAYGNDVLGKIRGFKNFLETAKKDELESMVNSNPTYFYDILPFAYTLGVSNKWIDKFETIIQMPSWYNGTDDFTVPAFGASIVSTMNVAQSVMTSGSSISRTGSSGGGLSDRGSSGSGGGS